MENGELGMENWELGIGNWELGIGDICDRITRADLVLGFAFGFAPKCYWRWVNTAQISPPFISPSPHPPIPPSPHLPISP